MDDFNDQFYVPGWDNDREAIDLVLSELETPYASMTQACEIPYEDLPKQYFPWQIHKSVTGLEAIVYNQGQVGSCVGMGATSAVETLCVNEIFRGENQEFKHLVQEVTYGGSRVEANGGRPAFRGDGSTGGLAAKFLKGWGVIYRGVHGKYDLTKYSEARCREYGSKGVPDDIEPAVKAHPVSEIVQVRSWENAVKLMAQGYGIFVCSDQGFGSKNSNGVAPARGSWAHCMELWGYDLTLTADKEDLGCIRNSWGPRAHPGASGPGNPPQGTFWARASTISSMLKQGDSYAVAGLGGFDLKKPLDIDYSKI